MLPITLLSHGPLASIATLAHGNPFFSGGLALGAIGGAVAYARRAPANLFAWVRSRCVYTVEIRSQDDTFNWYAHWLNEHPSTRRARNLTLSRNPKRSAESYSTGLGSRKLDKCSDSNDSAREEAVMPPLLFRPAPGSHLVRHRDRWIWFNLSRNETSGGETLTISTWFGGVDFFQALTEEAFRASIESRPEGLRIFTRRSSYWREGEVRPKRPASSIVLDADTYQHLESDVRRFLSRKEFYRQAGTPWRRGYLLHGAPGNGKSSLVAVIASEMNLPIYMLNLADASMTDAELQEALSETPSGAIVLIEEIDTIYAGRDAAIAAGNRSSLSFGGLLNALDGVAAQDGRLLFLTTNHPEILDEALIRHGRVDVHVALKNASTDQIGRIFERFFPGLEPAAIALVRTVVPPYAHSMAALQEYCMRHLDDPDAAIADLSELAAPRALVEATS